MILFSLFLSTVYKIRDESHKQKIKRETNNNITEDTYMCRNIENNLINHSHMKEKMPNILNSFE